MLCIGQDFEIGRRTGLSRELLDVSCDLDNDRRNRKDECSGSS